MPQPWERRTGPALVASLLTLFVAIVVVGQSGSPSASVSYAHANLEPPAFLAARASLSERMGDDAAQSAEAVRFGGDGTWQTGTLAVAGDDPLVFVYVARRTGSGWQAAIEGGPEFGPLARQASVALAGTPSADLLATTSVGGGTAGVLGAAISHSTSPGAAKLSLPWAVGQAWRLTGGPHSNSGAGRPWSSLDFAGPTAGRSLRVRAARGGVVLRPCRNLVQIRHSGGWETSYYHLAHITVRAGQHVKRGTPLGWTSTKAGCGGWATGPHVHFALKRYGRYVSIAGTAIGGWYVRAGRSPYLGCLVRRHRTHCAPSGRVKNAGGIGSIY